MTSPQATPKRRQPVDEPTFNFTARISVRAGNAFIMYCEAERISYREGFDRLVGTTIPEVEQQRIYKPSKEATVPLSIRPPLSVANRFIAWCKANRLSYWEGLHELMTGKGI